MKLISVELLTDEGNNAVLRLPGRTFPGVLIQGDTLTVLLENLLEVKSLMLESSNEDAINGIGGIIDDIGDLKSRYDKACVDSLSK